MRRTLMFSVLALGCVGPLAARNLGTIDFEPCTLSAPGSAAGVDAQCATVSVPEDRTQPDGRHIELALAWIPAREEADPDPVFLLAGGPGQSARDSYPMVAPAFADIHRRHHILLLDQRGTGASHPLVCRNSKGDPAFAEQPDDNSPEALRAFAERCRDALSVDSDLRHYTTTDAIADIDDIRQRVGAERIDLIGVSYGTRVAQQYAGRYRPHLRAMVLDSTVPNSEILGASHARNLEDALEIQFARCRADSACSRQLGDPRALLDRLTGELKAQPREVAYRDADTGELKHDTLTFGDLGGVLRMYAYMPAMAAMLPLVLHEAAEGDGALLMAQARMLFKQIGGSINHGMELSVICSEDAAQLEARPEDVDTVLGVEMIDFLKAQCAAWPAGETPADFHQPLSSDVPTLLLAGEYDPVTPPRWARSVAGTLSQSRVLEARGQGHGLLGVGCMPKLVARFIETADPKALDAHCLDELPYTPPFAGFYGWEP